MTHNIDRRNDINYGDWLTIVDPDGDAVNVVTDRKSGLGLRTYKQGEDPYASGRGVVRIEGNDLDALKVVIDHLVAVRDGEATHDEPLVPEPYWANGDFVKLEPSATFTYHRAGGTWWSFTLRRGFRPSATDDEGMRREVERRANAEVRRANA